mmetsp:Transcript_27896/g.54924  ORF Transcript_27896/g.54924 Transcript_27896/m.54924 type:complete len:520 (+) Transcript_27896:42-1601(+)|eukprot:CAMPEP_0175144750 /NCGR_PEP_ID=MMETSP0087-20121206/14335_1 /TAXON_ID=136419 /ORGANISM="Unknown Unknown, Strain D1" /LENGTH=519 /DNA_ID=CAMNT_0016429313 /DNA_START=42 /DNA_END=1601 /DNA_ORIENTATION=-
MSNTVKFPDDGTVAAALTKLHKEVEGSNFLVLGYSDKVTLCVVAEGPGGLEECKPHLPEDTERYVLLRKDHQVEMARTVKFAYVTWTPPKLKIMRKAMLSTHKGQVKDLLQPHHVTMDCNDASDLNEKEIMDKIGFSSGTKVHETTKQAYTAPSNISSDGAVRAIRRASLKNTDQVVPNMAASAKSTAGLSWADADAAKAALQAVKSDTDDTNWLLAGYENMKTLKVLYFGSGGVEEMCSKLDGDQALYGYFRVTEAYDKSVTVKFCYMKLMSSGVSPVNRAKISTHAGFLQDFFSPVHINFDISDAKDISPQIVTDKIGSYTGTKSHVTSKTETFLVRQADSAANKGKHAAVNESAAGAGQTDSGRVVLFDDEKAFKEAIADVRSDATDTSWMLASYSSKDTLSLVGSGAGNLDALYSALQLDQACFGLLRVTDKRDMTVAVKFVYIRYQPSSYAPMKRGEVSTLIGEIDACFSQSHVDFTIAAPEELTEQQLMDKVQAAAGTKDFVTTKEGNKSLQL